MKLLCITDPTTHSWDDATTILYERFADHPEIDFYHCPESIIDSTGKLRVKKLDKSLLYEDFLKLDSMADEDASFSDFDTAFCRTDKPYRKDYKKNLSLFENQVKFVNRPSSLIKLSQKIEMSAIVAEYMPNYIVSRDPNEVEEFLNKFETIVAKRNVGYGGKSVYKIWKEGGKVLINNKLDGTQEHSSIKQVVDYLNDLDTDPYQYMRYLSRVHEGDKRIHVIEGEVLGAMLRKAADESWVQNTSSGGQALSVEVTEREIEIVKSTASDFLKLGIYTLGFDFLTDDDGLTKLSEVNCGNIGGYNLYEAFTGVDVIAKVVDWVLDFGTRD